MPLHPPFGCTQTNININLHLRLCRFSRDLIKAGEFFPLSFLLISILSRSIFSFWILLSFQIGHINFFTDNPWSLGIAFSTASKDHTHSSLELQRELFHASHIDHISFHTPELWSLLSPPLSHRQSQDSSDFAIIFL